MNGQEQIPLGNQFGTAIVLIAEDEEPIAETLSMIISDAGYSVVMAMHGRQALELARAHRPALIITDLMMPYLDGAALIAALRDDARKKSEDQVPIVLMTAAGTQRTLGIEADAVLAKPFDVDEVEHLLRQFLDVAHSSAR